jgi:succinoglycan biosynthesis transport protein ExoP
MVQPVPRFGQISEVKPSNMLWRPSIVQNQWTGRRVGARMSAFDAQQTGGDLGKIVQLLLRNKHKLLLTTLTSLFLGLTYLWIATPMYTATASLFVDPRTRKVEEASPSGIGQDTTLLESQVAIITSDGVLQKVVNKLNLARDPEFVSEASALGHAVKSIFVRGSANAEPDEQALAALKKAVKVSRAQKTYVLDITTTASTPQKATDIAQAVIDAYFADQSEAKIAEAKRSTVQLDAHLGELRDQVRRAETRADDYKKANKILTSEGGVVNEQQLTKMSSELVSARAVAAESKARRDQVQNAIKLGAEPDVLGDAARSGLIAKLREQYTQVARREASLATQLQPGHPLMADVRSQLAAVKAQITAELKRVASAAESEYQVAANREKELSAQIEKSKQDVATVNTAQIHARELDQEVAASRELLKRFLDSAKATEQLQSLSTPDARVISPPVAPSSPSRPLPWLVLALSLLTGLGGGAAWVLNGGKSESAIATADQLSEQTGLAAVSVIPDLKSASAGQGAQDLPYGVQFSDLLSALGSQKDKAAAVYNQAVLRLLSKIKAQGRAGRPNTVMFASARTGTGNSATVLAVAYSAALAGERILLVDATSINPELSSVFAGNLPKSTTVILDSREHLNRIISRDARSGLSFLPIALADLRTLKTQQRRRLVAGLNLISQDYDWVFIDAGALLDDEAATTLLPATNQVFILGRAGITSRSDVDDMMEILQPVRDRIAGAVLTFSPSQVRT